MNGKSEKKPDTCKECNGPLRVTADGHYHSKRAPKGGALDICCNCRPPTAGACKFAEHPAPKGTWNDMPTTSTATKNRSAKRRNVSTASVKTAKAPKAAKPASDEPRKISKEKKAKLGANRPGFTFAAAYAPCSTCERDTARVCTTCRKAFCRGCQKEHGHKAKKS